MKTVFGDLQPGKQRILRKKRRLLGHWLYLAALKLDDGSLLVIATQTAPILPLPSTLDAGALKPSLAC